MKPQEIEKLIETILAQAKDPDHIFTVWKVGKQLCDMFSEIDANIYSDDPMSEHAPTECFSLHMKDWDNLENKILSNYYEAENNYQLYLEEIHAPMNNEELYGELPF